MSGGVDSSVAAHLLQQVGHDVIGVFMRHGQTVEACAAPAAGVGTSSASAAVLPILSPRADHKQGCCTASDAADARRVADRLDIPFYALDFTDSFGQIIDYFVAEYQAARTPNPCVMCNNWLKFGRLFDYADSIGAEFVATGHYARLTDEAADLAKPSDSLENPSPALRRGLDAGKDQSYVLFGVERRLLSRMLLPVGGLAKPEVRRLARELGLRVADKKDSQDICFVSSGDHADFVHRRAAAQGHGGEDRGGAILTTDGTVVGHHNGIERFTIGQRKGLGVALGEPRYVVRLDLAKRQVIIGTHADLGRTEFSARGCNWLIDEPTAPLRCLAQIRYNSRPALATIEPLPGARLRVALDEPGYGVAPGQAVVCYDQDRVLGGGWIE
jgi:tRNA-specific 2-thiouridylase